jgi:choline transport protein
MLLAEGSRSIYAFSRDQGLPFSDTLSRIHAKTKVPTTALILATIVQMRLNSIYLGCSTSFNTIIFIATEAFYVSYALPLLANILKHLSPASASNLKMDGSYALGRCSLPLNLIGFIYLSFTAMKFDLPTNSPVDMQNMNYTSAVIVAIMLISMLTWWTQARGHFSVPTMSTNMRSAEKPKCAREDSGVEIWPDVDCNR